MQSFDHSFKAMGGPCRIQINCSQEQTALAALSAGEAEVRRLEHKYSRYLADSVTSAINAAAGISPIEIDDETAGLLAYAETAWRESDGLFDPTSGLLRQVWDFHSGSIPAADEVESLLVNVGWQKLRWTQTSAFLPLSGMELDFGGFVKEYAADCAAAVIRHAGVEHALVDLAGDMASVGGRDKGVPWVIGIRHPDHREQAVAKLELSGRALASSGDYERFIEIGGERYGHILNPLTGWPVQGLAAVSVSAPQCLVAGSAATLAMLKPKEESLQWLQALGLPWVAVDHAGRAYPDAGIRHQQHSIE